MKTNLYCPKCGEEIPVDQPFWNWQGKWYCSEKCARAVSNQTRII